MAAAETQPAGRLAPAPAASQNGYNCLHVRISRQRRGRGYAAAAAARTAPASAPPRPEPRPSFSAGGLTGPSGGWRTFRLPKAFTSLVIFELQSCLPARLGCVNVFTTLHKEYAFLFAKLVALSCCKRNYPALRVFQFHSCILTVIPKGKVEPRLRSANPKAGVPSTTLSGNHTLEFMNYFWIKKKIQA